ncbi:aldehyde dehydrogenase family protein [Microbacterium deminutum]|uniref:Aldehyde dehydrogenase family protein n=1 Tax=Microbacterium deminutum TaxID=344164 RepID=A0ABN2QKK3_9MICO
MTQAAPATSPDSAPNDSAPGLPQADRADLDAAIAELGIGLMAWSHLTLEQRARLMERLKASVSAVAAEWTAAAAATKGLEPTHPLHGEDWLAGPYGVVTALDAYRSTLLKLAAGESPLTGVKTSAAPGERVRAHVFPLTPVDGLLLSGFTGEVWFEPGVSVEEARRAAGLAQLSPTTTGGIGLVLGAGNVSSIPVLDVLYELLANNRVALLKLNPTQDPLVPAFERALAPLIEPGFVRIVRGGAEVGEYLTGHPGIAHVHITGAARTFEAIVWGSSADTEETARRKRENSPKLQKPITAELGGVSPIIVVPGAWTDADLRFQAEHVVTMRMHNSGHNCIAGQVVLVSADWPQRDAFLTELRKAYEGSPQRLAWYPKSDEKLAAAASDYPDAIWCADGTRALVEIGAADDATALETTEYFAPVLGVVSLPGNGQEFLDAAVAHANDKLVGTLGANVLIDPATEAALGGGFERAIAAMRYGSIAINAWTGFGYLISNMTWGGFPGATLQDVDSGLGVVHNALLLDRVERSVGRGPFRPFPRSASALFGPGRFSVLPKPPWFTSSRTGSTVSEGFTRFQMRQDWLKFVGTLVQAFRA